MEKNLISVIIPCYNCAQYLPDTISSLNAQTYQNFEAIFVDDGSTDNTLQTLQKLCAGKDNFHVHTQKNGGVSAARNTALAHAKGEFVVLLDADDMIAPNHLADMIENIGAYDVLITDFKKVGSNSHFQSFRKTAKFHNVCCFAGGGNPLIAQTIVTKKFCTGFWNKLLRLSIIEKMQNYPNVFNTSICYGEDALFGVEYFLLCNSAKRIDLKSYYYRKSKNSLSKKFNENILSITKSFPIYLQLCQNNKVALEYCKVFIATVSIELLFRIARHNHKNPEMIQQLFDNIKRYKPDLKNCKEAKFYYKHLTSATVALLKILLFKQLRTSDKKQK